MDSNSNNPVRLFVNPFTFWSDLAIKTGQVMWASAHAAAMRANTAPKVAVIPTADAPPLPNALEAPQPVQAEAPRNAKVAVLPVANAPRKARASVKQASKVVRFKATRSKLRSKANGKRGARR